MKKTKLGPKTYEEALLKRRIKQTKEWGLPSLGKLLKISHQTSQNAPKRIKKPKLKSVSSLKKTLWEIIKLYIRERDKSICFTSGVQVEGSNRHVGHGIPSSVGGILLRYHPWNLHIQSYVENIHHSGNGGVYYRNQLSKYGQEKVDRIYELKKHTGKADRYFFETMIDLYKQGNEEEIVKFLESYL